MSMAGSKDRLANQNTAVDAVLRQYDSQDQKHRPGLTCVNYEFSDCLFYYLTQIFCNLRRRRFLRAQASKVPARIGRMHVDDIIVHYLLLLIFFPMFPSQPSRSNQPTLRPKTYSRLKRHATIDIALCAGQKTDKVIIIFTEVIVSKHLSFSLLEKPLRYLSLVNKKTTYGNALAHNLHELLLWFRICQCLLHAIYLPHVFRA